MRWTPPTRAASGGPEWGCIADQSQRGGVRDEGYYRGVGLAKNVCAVHGVDEHRKVVLKRQVSAREAAGAVRAATGVPAGCGGLPGGTPTGRASSSGLDTGWG